MQVSVNPKTGRLPVGVVRHLNRLFEGDARTERQIEVFIGAQYGAKNFFYIPPAVAAEMIRRPADFQKAAQAHWQRELNL